MKKHFSFGIFGTALAVCMLLAGCAKEGNPYEGEATPQVSITTTDTQFVLDQAQITLTLSQFIHKDVAVNFEVDGIEREAIDLPENITIQAGAVKKVITMKIDEDKASIGNKTVDIAIKEAENATLGNPSQVSIGINVEDVALVNASATDFNDDMEATVTFTLSKFVTKDVVLTVGYDTADGSERAAFPESALTYDNTVTIPAGSKVGTMAVKVNKSGVEEGAYQAHFTVSDYGSNAKAGTDPDVTLLVNVGFQPTLVSTDVVYFRYASGWWYVDRNDLHPYYFLWSEPSGDGDAADMDYVKAAMYRCRDWVKDSANEAAWLAYWQQWTGYEAYVPNGCPQLTANKTGYWGWPMIMVNEGAIEDLDEVVYGDGTYHTFLVGFDENKDLLETYQYYLLTK